MRRDQGVRGSRGPEPETRTPEPQNPSPIGLTTGDPAGIGPEIVLKALGGRRHGVRIIGPRAVFEREQQRIGTDVDLGLVDDSIAAPPRFAMGRPQKCCGCAAYSALEIGADLLKRGAIRALVTAPVSKEALRLAGFAWPGQTEFLAARLGVKDFAMLAWTPRFKAVFVTIHLPLARVSRCITAEAVAEKVRLLDAFLRREASGVRRQASPPRIGVMALNPHADEFTLGEEARIRSGIALARRRGVNAVGPIPSDAAVASVSSSHSLTPSLPRSRPFDGFVAMYHDQAMIPAKLLGRGAGVNVTLGLGRIRTSPLHGTAFDIAGRGVASPASMQSAIRLAQRLSRPD
jgi:4-hydroxythreonine-4-phosphate dehydrogenase